jgi:hypothetical protein
MSSVQLATMSTGLWLVATVSLFILLAGWSSGESWGLTASIVRGVRGWAEHDRPATAVSSPFVESLGPMFVPRRPIGGVAAARLPGATRPSASTSPSTRPFADNPAPAVEVVDLGEHRISPR